MGIKISNIARNVTDSILREIVSAKGVDGFGEMQLIHPFSGDISGFAYLECSDPQNAWKMVCALRGVELQGMKLWAELTKDRAQWISNRKSPGETPVIEISNLHCTVSEEDIQQLIKIYCP